MMSSNHESKVLMLKLNEVADYCKNLEKLLKQDIEFFKKNNISGVVSNSQAELLEIEKISGLLTNIKESHPVNDKQNNINDIIQSHLSKLDKSSSDKMKELLQKISATSLNCANLIMSNNNIVFNNLIQLKKLFNTIIDKQTGNSTYTKDGKMDFNSNK
jgi:flagellar biosynthesis/type III secretory pathway chaperone